MAATSITLRQPVYAEGRDARPIRATAQDTLWDRAVASRDAIAAHVKAVLAEDGIEALVLTSQNGIYPPWVRLEAWLPDDDTEKRICQLSELNFVVDISPFHRTEVVTTARLRRGRKSIEVAKRPVFTDDHVAEWTRYALDRGPRPSNYTPRRDAFLAALGKFIWPLTPHRNPVAKPFRTSFWGTNAIIIAAIIAFSLLNSVVGPEYPAFSILALLALIATVTAVIVSTLRRRQIIAVSSQPLVPPRDLGLVDSWHVLVSGIGPDQDLLRQRLLARFAGARAVGIETQPEIQGYRTPNGYEERERLTLSKGQSVVHVLVHRYGKDLFVGWHANLNWAKWGEFLTGLSKVEDGRQTEFHTLRPSVYQPNLFDLMDLNGLSDFVHRQFEQELKGLLTERAIDQEIDFEIVRGDRNLALDKDRHASKDDDKPSSRRWAGIMNSAREWQQTSITEKYQSAELSTQGRPKTLQKPGALVSWFPAFLVLPAIAIAIVMVTSTIELSAAQRAYINPGSFALAIGLWLYAGVGVRMATLAFSVSYLLNILGHTAFNWITSYSNPDLLPIAYIITPLAWLTAGSIASPALRSATLWLIVTISFVGLNILALNAVRDGTLSRDLYPFALMAGSTLALAIIGWRLGRAKV